MLLLALQTTLAVTDNRDLDGLTLVLVVVFIASMAALTAIMLHRTGTGENAPPAIDPAERPRPELTPPIALPAEPPAASRPIERLPAWWHGVTLPQANGSLAQAGQAIEELLEARRAGDLARGLTLFTPEYLTRFRRHLGVDEDRLLDVLRSATLSGDPPALRSVELLDASGDRMTVQVGYSDRTSDIYRLASSQGRWLIDDIEPR